MDVDVAAGRVRARLEEACRRAGREPGSVRLVAVTKTVAVETVLLARRAGLEDFGENRAADLAVKAERVPATWHFLGKLQTGTAARVGDHADVVHSGEPGAAIAKVARRAAARGRRPACLIQVDFTGRRQGVDPEDLPEAVRAVSALEGLDVVGLMTLPPLTPDPEGARPYFARLRELAEGLRAAHPGLRELSMGMSRDYEVGVEEGATMVRVGTALFGERPPRGPMGETAIAGHDD